MAVLLFLASVIATFVAMYFYGAAESAIHQILAGVVGISACVLFGCACIVDAINSLAKKLNREATKPKTSEAGGATTPTDL